MYDGVKVYLHTFFLALDGAVWIEQKIEWNREPIWMLWIREMSLAPTKNQMQNPGRSLIPIEPK
jgi:hypothetical protein